MKFTRIRSVLTSLSFICLFATLSLLAGCNITGGTTPSTTNQALAICHTVGASINAITSAAKLGWISTADLNAADPYINTVASVCDGATPPTLASVLTSAFTDAMTYLSTASVKATAAAAKAVKAANQASPPSVPAKT